ncbi:MAG TPA: ethylbenzene dehydrogenase-related protein, partial [Vicinamibacteria bacterium]|nr:ethylbenzene dehydrogenase-related protein [Vicinamibacteria bacterium]
MKQEAKPRTRRGALLGLGAAAVAAAAACRAKPPLVPEVVVGPAAGALPSLPDDGAWRKAPMHVARLLLQDMVEPRLMSASTPDVSVQALTDGTRVAFRLAWKDAEHDDVSAPARFPDACAVQLPSHTAADVPAPQMGEPGRPVEITLWRASWQASVEGRRGSIRDVYPNAATDHYPFEAASLASHGEARRALARRYAPAEAVGNPMAGPRATPVEDLVAEGPGSLT